MINTKTLIKRQQGMTFISLIMLLALIGFFVLLGLKLFPIYSNNFKIKGIVESLAEEKNLYSMSRKEILSLIDKRVNINMVEGFEQEHLKIVLKDNGNKEYRIIYEDRRVLLGNLDVVAKFDDYIVIAPSGAVRHGL